MESSREFIHGKKFDAQWNSLGLTDEDLRDLENMLLENPKLGPVMKGTGRLRKMRFSYGNRGKSHCARVCYVDFEFHGRPFSSWSLPKMKWRILARLRGIASSNSSTAWKNLWLQQRSDAL